MPNKYKKIVTSLGNEIKYLGMNLQFTVYSYSPWTFAFRGLTEMNGQGLSYRL